jgi:hypothetical protein
MLLRASVSVLLIYWASNCQNSLTPSLSLSFHAPLSFSFHLVLHCWASDAILLWASDSVLLICRASNFQILCSFEPQILRSLFVELRISKSCAPSSLRFRAPYLSSFEFPDLVLLWASDSVLLICWASNFQILCSFEPQIPCSLFVELQISRSCAPLSLISRAPYLLSFKFLDLVLLWASDPMLLICLASKFPDLVLLRASDSVLLISQIPCSLLFELRISRSRAPFWASDLALLICWASNF